MKKVLMVKPIVVLSGKGGVGKSTVACQLALHLSQNYRVGVLDVDLCGPSMPQLLRIQDAKVHQSSRGWIPVYVDTQQRLSCMSIAFLLKNATDSVVWRGPKKTAMIKQFLRDVYWGELDYLVIDTPPGTSDEHMAVIEGLQAIYADTRLDAVLVTTPQAVSLADVMREIDFCRTVGLNILGMVENMSGYACPHCSTCTNVFSKGGGESLCKQYDLTFLGCLPIDPQFTLRQSLQPFEAFVPIAHAIDEKLN
jgi:Mrp family chromosome partitioning ATPase